MQDAARAALSLNGRSLKKRPLRVTRTSRQVAAAKLGGGNASLLDAPSPGYAARVASPGGKPAGLSGNKPSFRAAAGKRSAAGSSPEDWQGTQTKGKGKKVRVGVKGGAGRSSGGGKGAHGAPANRARADKRPSVAARKARELAGKGKPEPAATASALKVKVS